MAFPIAMEEISMRKIIAFLLAGVMAFLLTACDNSTQKEETTRNEGTEVSAADDVVMENSMQTETNDAGNTDMNSTGSSILIAYFSPAGEQYSVGVVEEGNTSIIAHMIAEQTEQTCLKSRR